MTEYFITHVLSHAISTQFFISVVEVIKKERYRIFSGRDFGRKIKKIVAYNRMLRVTLTSSQYFVLGYDKNYIRFLYNFYEPYKIINHQ